MSGELPDDLGMAGMAEQQGSWIEHVIQLTKGRSLRKTRQPLFHIVVHRTPSSTPFSFHFTFSSQFWAYPDWSLLGFCLERSGQPPEQISQLGLWWHDIHGQDERGNTKQILHWSIFACFLSSNSGVWFCASSPLGSWWHDIHGWGGRFNTDRVFA